MTATPALRSAELFNQLAAVEIEDTAVAARLAAELAILVRRNKTDFQARVAYSHALLSSGARDEALEQMASAYGLQDVSNIAAMDRLAMLNYFTGQRAFAVELSKRVAFSDTRSKLLNNHVQIAAWAVDLEYLRDLAERHAALNIDSAAAAVLEYVEDVGAASLAAYQGALLSVVKDCQVAICFSPVRDESGEMMFMNNIYFDRTKAKRRELEDQLDAIVESVVGEPALGRIRTVLTPAPARDDGPIIMLRPSLRAT